MIEALEEPGPMQLDEGLAAGPAWAHLAVGDLDVARDVPPVLRSTHEAAVLG